ncbi:MAG: transposase [Bacteroidales bacterium]|nr:transposase [Bacteroidales bacterium]
MRKQRTHYDKSFKENAVKLSIERKNMTELAHELGIEPLLLYRWRKEYQHNGPLSFPGNGVQALSEEAKELADLKKRLLEAETERDILKKATSLEDG